ncbi:DNA polymerase lambda [Leucoagaricus sp. SymC.cos]|nr:DNA polymerase lambda [Leucoagaricus sp. SymC.cos]
MPRSEAKSIFDLIKPLALSIDSKLFVEIMGSYRRGKLDCGDIDILITRPTNDDQTHSGILARLLPILHKEGIITEDLAIPENFAELECVYRGLCRLPREDSRRRRIDFLTVPWASRGAALLYYTGDDIFNRAMRLKANKMGYSLNQRGLFSGIVRDLKDSRIKTNEGTLVASETEQEIFRILDVPWQEPHERVRG